MAKRPPQDEEETGNPTVMNPQHGAADDDAVNDGSTAFVRVEDSGSLPPPRRKEAAPSAPKKGLQVQLPDDEPEAPPPPKRKLAPPPAETKGRRGAWWDQKSERSPDDEEPAEEPSPDDNPGATAFLRAEEPPPPPRRKAPEPRRRAPEPAPADDGSTQFYRPDQAVLQAETRERPAHPEPAEGAIPWKQVILVLVIALVVTLAGVGIVFREELFGGGGGKAHGRSTRPAAESTDKE